MDLATPFLLRIGPGGAALRSVSTLLRLHALSAKRSWLRTGFHGGRLSFSMGYLGTPGAACKDGFCEEPHPTRSGRKVSRHSVAVFSKPPRSGGILSGRSLASDAASRLML